LRLSKSTILALVSGILFSFTWNYIFSGILLFIAFVPLLFVLENKLLSNVKVYNLSFMVFMLYHLGTVWWLAKSSFLGFLVIVVSNSMYLALAILLIYRIRKTFGFVAGLLSFVSIWLAFEYIHFIWELSWPFMNLGNWLGQMPKLIQWYEYTGVLGGTLWILLVNVSIYLIIRNIRNWKKMKTAFFITSCILIIITPILFSKNLYSNYHEGKISLNIKIIQPNIDPYKEKYNTSLFNDQINSQITLTKFRDSLGINCYLFPESSFPLYLNEDSTGTDFLLKKLSNELIKSDNVLILGGLYTYRIQNGDSLFYNSAFCLDSKLETNIRHKSKLVIGVEKMPFQDYFVFFKSLNLDFGGFTNSLTIDKEPVVFCSSDQSVSIAPIICYESVYGEYVSEFVKKGATFIAVLTNDGWWGESPGFKQHFMHSRVRAIETRRNVVRSANTGLSCIINGRGDIVSEIPPFKRLSLTGKVYQRTKLSFYTRNGDYIGKIALWISLAMIIILIFNWAKQKFK